MAIQEVYLASDDFTCSYASPGICVLDQSVRPRYLIEVPGIKLETNFDELGGLVLTPVRPSGPSFTDRAAATRIDADLEITNDIVPKTKGVGIHRAEVKSEDSDDESEPNEEYDEDSVAGVEIEETAVDDVPAGPCR